MKTTTPCTVLIINADGVIRAETWADGGTLEHLQESVDGTVTVWQNGEVDVWLNDEALFSTTPEVNQPVSLWLSSQGYGPGIVYGTAVLATSDADGATVSLPDERLTELHRLFSQCPEPLCDAEPGLPCDPECLWPGPGPNH